MVRVGREKVHKMRVRRESMLGESGARESVCVGESGAKERVCVG